ncbi:DUF423 domain-containing protein [Paenimyroides tangerinum]|uniref:DUF423 domain-containing protein n=1 Tax=Paenimyroides tangerinum TaxID=2488728 RepID=A0A3P3WA41_9FLAO|nr:DUF423 domain-containing protein [Paenimyroides tangerinum]RRJ91860.1 DUF423 domain-containing protein [Paenimyroides tangerinum]
MSIKLIRIAIVFGLISIILGAFGAHALKAVLSEQQLTSFETGVRYQMYQALFLLFVATTNFLTDKAKKITTIILSIGVLFFSGSIYLLATQELSGINFKFLGPITPIGGLLIMISWIYVAFCVGKQKNNN